MAAHYVDTDFAQLVRQLRYARRLTQEQLARQLDVTIGTLNGWENGRHRPVRAQRARLLRMAKAKGLEPFLGTTPAGGAQ